MNNLNIVILAAGQGTRMYSETPKVMHEIGGRPMLFHVINVALKLNPSKLIIIHGHKGEVVKQKVNELFSNNDFIWAFQKLQLGTAHALSYSIPYLEKDAKTLVLYGDVPLISVSTIINMLDKINENNIIMLTANFSNPNGYGRVIRDNQLKIIDIVEEKDASISQKLIPEVNSGIYILPNKFLKKWLEQIDNKNKQNEYYLTDIIKIAVKENYIIDNVLPDNNYEIMGVNNKVQLENLERKYQLVKANELLEKGVTLIDKHRIDIRGEISIGIDTSIDINCIFEGINKIGNGVRIGSNCFLKNVNIEDGVEIRPYSIIEGAEISQNCKIGPFARIRPNTHLGNGVHIGNFVEVKNSYIDTISKVNHLSYIGDTKIGKKVNVGAGSVTCNYDGINKHKTIIEDNVFIGSGTMMVAPIKIGKGSLIGAGSTITKDTPEDELTLSRIKQTTITGWLKKKKS